MLDWFVLTHNPRTYQSLIKRLKEIGVEVYSPCKVKLYKRHDRPSSLRRETQLFPGYLLLQFDELAMETHPSKITSLKGAYGFVMLAGERGRVTDEIVGQLKERLLRINCLQSCADYHGLSSDLAKSLHLIIEMPCETARKAAFFALLRQCAIEQRLASRPRARVYSALHPL